MSCPSSWREQSKIRIRNRNQTYWDLHYPSTWRRSDGAPLFRHGTFQHNTKKKIVAPPAISPFCPRWPRFKTQTKSSGTPCSRRALHSEWSAGPYAQSNGSDKSKLINCQHHESSCFGFVLQDIHCQEVFFRRRETMLFFRLLCIKQVF